MKTITYTQMRSDLSATLELLRSGESVTVTQRGKPDLVIDAKVVSEPASQNQIAPANKTIEVLRASKTTNDALTHVIMNNLSPQTKEALVNVTKQFESLLASDEARKAMMKIANTVSALQGVSESFANALKHTQIKHADIIKILEDK